MNFEWLQLISLLGLGSVLTVIVQSIVNSIGNKNKWKRDIAKVVIIKQIEASENAVKYLQTLEDALYSIRMACSKEHLMNTSSITLLQNAKDTFLNILPSMQTNLAAIGMYYDFKDVDRKYDIYKVLDNLQYEVSKISTYYSHTTMDDSSGIVIIVSNNVKIDDVIIEFGKTTDIMIHYIEEIQWVIRDTITGFCR